jgi:hypothetical protein
MILGGSAESTRFLFNQVRTWYPEDQLIAVLEQGKPVGEIVRYRISRLGVAKTIGQLIFITVIAPLVRRLSASRREELIRSLELMPREIPPESRISVTSVNEVETLKLIANFAPDIILVNGTRIISGTVLSATCAPFINTHVGITPKYRGVHGGYWALWSGDPENFGVTVHYVDTGVDTGQIIYQARAVPEARDSFSTYPLLQQAAAFPGIKAALERLSINLAHIHRT